MSFLQSEIARGRCSEVVVCCADAGGEPVAGAQVSVNQVASAFRVGARVTEETRPALPTLARLGTEVLVSHPAAPALRTACADLGLRVTHLLPAPRGGESFSAWRGRCAPDDGSRSGDTRALDASGSPAADAALGEALAFLRERVGCRVLLLGLPLPLPEVVAEADGYGVSLSAGQAPGGRWHAGVLRRELLAATGRLGECFVHDVQAPPLDSGFRSAAWGLGGAERVQADVLAELATVCMSVPGVSGLFFDPLVDSLSDPSQLGLLAHDLRPKRAYKVLRALFQKEWRTHARGTTDTSGRFSWKGFRGTYDLTVVFPDGAVYSGTRILPASAGAVVEWAMRPTTSASPA